jgi:two-component system, sensor histidine kinase FlrB
MSSQLPSRRFREVQLLIGAALVMLMAVVVAELKGILGLATAVEDEGRRTTAATAQLLAALAATSGEDALFEARERGVGVALVAGERVARATAASGPLDPAWWPWKSRAGWEAAGRPVAGPLEASGGSVLVAYQPLRDGRVLRVVAAMSSEAILVRWRWLAGGLALVVAGGGGLVAWLLIGRVLAPYRELLAEAVRVTGRPPGVAEDRFLVGTFRDTVQRLEASEAALRQRADELAVLAEVLTRESSAGVVITDVGGAVRAANRTAVAVAPLAIEVGKPAPVGLLAGGSRLHTGDLVMEVRRFPLLSSSGQPQGEVFFIVDTTRLEALERALREREGMAILGELAAGMAHEVRNALATMRGYLRLLPAAGEEDRERYLATMEGEASGLAEVLDRFLRFAQPQELRRDAVDLLRLVEECVAKVRAAFPSLDVAVRGESVSVSGDALALGVVLENLLRNAAEALADRPGKVEVRLQGGEEQVAVVVEDDGPGVSQELREKLFSPFVSSKPSGGLGLALARRLARLHGGDLEFRPRRGGGARFELRLPRGGMA